MHPNAIVNPRRIAIIGIGLALIGTLTVSSAHAVILTFDAEEVADVPTARAAWLAAIGIATPKNLVDFETGFTDGQNVSGVGGLFPDGLVITDTGPGPPTAAIEDDLIGGSNPVGNFAVTQDEGAYLELDFSAVPVDYVAFRDIDHNNTSGIVHFEGGGAQTIFLETTIFSGDSAEFFGIYRNDQPRIILVQLDATGDNDWGIDNIEYGVVPEPTALSLLALGLLALLPRRTRR